MIKHAKGPSGLVKKQARLFSSRLVARRMQESDGSYLKAFKKMSKNKEIFVFFWLTLAKCLGREKGVYFLP